MGKISRRVVLAALLTLGLATVGIVGPAGAQDRFIVLASTTSTENSGLFAYLLPLFEAETGIQVRVVAVGTGQALRIARSGDADVLLVHHRPSEEAFVAEGHGVKRFDLMFNDFVLVGPRDDPADVGAAQDAADAMRRIAASWAAFASRGDDSGTHKKERELWSAAGVMPRGDWYRELGAGMGATLNVASEANAYTLTDRGTWIAFQNKRDLVILMGGDQALFNPYSVILVNPARHPSVNAADGQIFIDWLISRAGQEAIADFRVDGQQLFFPSARQNGF